MQKVEKSTWHFEGDILIFKNILRSFVVKSEIKPEDAVLANQTATM